MGVTKNSVTSIRNKSYWNYNNLNPKDPVALNLFTQKRFSSSIMKKLKDELKEKKRERETKTINIILYYE